jgi:hypothetical protein
MNPIVSGAEFTITKNCVFTKPKINSNGRKSIGVLNGENMKSLYVSTPLMLTWGVNEYTENGNSYDMALQFPSDEYNNEQATKFLKNMQQMEAHIKKSAIDNSKDWLNKSKLTPEAIDALWTPMLKYPKDKNTDEPDYSRAPTLKIKIPFWDNTFSSVELYNENKEKVFPVDGQENNEIHNFIVKASQIATIIQCGGIWVANGKFGIVWKLFQAVVKPKTSLSGKCHVMLSEQDMNIISSQKVEDETTEPVSVLNTNMVADSDDEQFDNKFEKVEIETQLTEEKVVEVEDQPKKKKIVKKKPID